MRLCLIGDFSGTPDEGMKNISRTTSDILSRRHTVMTLNTREMINPISLIALKQFKPQVIHYLHGPTIRSLVMLQWIKFLVGNRVKTVVSATRPYFSTLARRFLPLVKPDLVLTQSKAYEHFFENRGFQVAFLPNGVDLSRFSPVSNQEKMHLRKTLGLPSDKTVVLHVGHIKPNRQLDLFFKIQAMEGIQVVVAGGTHEPCDEVLKDNLKREGITVIHTFMKEIADLYRASDLYLFPLMDSGSALPGTYNQVGAIDLPLSVLEAMACNLPVLTTRFGALKRLFDSGNGFAYADNREEILQKLKSVAATPAPATRSMVMPLDWNTVITQLEAAYTRLTRIHYPGQSTTTIVRTEKGGLQ